jgi:hypothetical protein
MLLLALSARAQTTAFTCQGQLGANGSPVTGSYDLRFRLLDTNSDLIAGPVTNAPVGVTNGLFTTTVNFGATAFDGSLRLLEIAVRNAGNTNAYTLLAPDQQITSTPYAIQSLSAAALSSPLAATNITGTLPVSDLATNVALVNSNLVFSGTIALDGVLTATNTANVLAGTFSGNGAGLASLPATNLTGILPDSLLSSNVAMLDATNANFDASVTAVLYTGSGHGLTNVPGAFFWLTVSGTNAQAGSNLGFIVTNSTAPVIISLPANPSVGDTFRVAGAGAGGWILTQNSGQSVLAGNLADTTGLNWTPQTNSGQRTWSGLASSSDGTKLVGVTSDGYIYLSANSGVTWTTNTTQGLKYWSSVAASTSGNNLVATVGSHSAGVSGNIYTSADGGNTWVSRATSQEWSACASSANGNNLAAVSYTGTIEVSANGGSTWAPPTNTIPSNIYWTGVASSEDGTHLVAVGNPGGGGYIYTSTNSGASWNAGTNGPYAWSAVASSADGTHLIAAVTGGTLYASVNSGATWFQENPNVTADWTAVVSSADGSHLAAVYDGGTLTTPGYIYTSDDSGSTWLQRSGAPDATWTAIAGSSDGSRLAAAVYNGDIYTSGQGSTTTGAGGYLTGDYQSALELQYVGGNVFLPLSHEGTIRAY